MRGRRQGATIGGNRVSNAVHQNPQGSMVQSMLHLLCNESS